MGTFIRIPWSDVYGESPHDVHKPDKAAMLAESFKQHGWSGRPLLAYDDGNGVAFLTGTHRLAALQVLENEDWQGEMNVPIVLADMDVIEAACEDRDVTVDS